MVRARRARSSQSTSGLRRPIASTTRSARTSSPSLVRTPVTWGTPSIADGPVTQRFDADAPPDGDARRFRSPRSRTPTSPIGRRPVTNRNRSSSGRGSWSVIDGGKRSKRLPPDASGVDETIDHARELLVEDLADPREQVVGLVELRNALAVPRVPGVARVAGGGAASRSSTVTSCPSLRQQHGRRQADDASAAHHDRCHVRLLPPVQPGRLERGDRSTTSARCETAMKCPSPSKVVSVACGIAAVMSVAHDGRTSSSAVPW